MKLLRSKSWYEKKAKLEEGCSIAAGKFPSEIFDRRPDRKMVSKSKTGIARSKTAATTDTVRRGR